MSELLTPTHLIVIFLIASPLLLAYGTARLIEKYPFLVWKSES